MLAFPVLVPKNDEVRDSRIRVPESAEIKRYIHGS
jgi:hypothetical protein